METIKVEDFLKRYNAFGKQLLLILDRSASDETHLMVARHPSNCANGWFKLPTVMLESVQVAGVDNCCGNLYHKILVSLKQEYDALLPIIDQYISVNSQTALTESPKLTNSSVTLMDHSVSDNSEAALMENSVLADSTLDWRPCLDPIVANRIVMIAARGPHNIDRTLLSIGFISDLQRNVFREDVFNRVLATGCDISRGQIPNGPNDTLRIVRDTIEVNARPRRNRA